MLIVCDCRCDLLWSDPEDANGFGMSPRGAGFLFGPDVVQNFCETNKVDLICRFDFCSLRRLTFFWFQSSSTCNGRLQVALQWNGLNSMVRSELLLSLRQRGSYSGIRWQTEQRVHYFRSSATGELALLSILIEIFQCLGSPRSSCQKATSRLFPLMPKTTDQTRCSDQ